MVTSNIAFSPLICLYIHINKLEMIIMFDSQVRSVQFEGYKSFPRGKENELDISPFVSVLIGKNNCGKSSCLDALQCVFEPRYYLSAGKLFGRVSATFVLDANSVRCGFSPHMGGGDVPRTIGSNHYTYGSKFIGKRIVADLSVTASGRDRYMTLSLSEEQPELRLPEGKSEWERVIKAYNDFQSKIEFRRINADRDIVPEEESSDEWVNFNGEGTTNLLRKYINYSLYDEKLVEECLLRELNKIMAPDAHFQSIRVQQIDDGETTKWEIFLEEDDGRRFALSKSGSGLKTIILMLVNLYILPETKKYKNREIVYAFEELENNLHPALQRKVFEYIYEYAAKKKAHIFITTHSHIAINTFFEKENTALYHIQKINGESSISPMKDRTARMDVLSDLDVRASDLFQSNGIIWVEGPSDRIYINRWLKEFCDSKYIEGSHYQFLYYGGKTLSHFTADEKLDDLISILKTNQNAAIVIDSDKKQESARINSTKARIRKEFDAIGGFCWITKGKEIENYISTPALRAMYGESLPVLGQYDLFPEYIDSKFKGFSSKKVPFAKGIVEHITAENSKDVLDLKKQIEKLYSLIQKWNQ